MDKCINLISAEISWTSQWDDAIYSLNFPFIARIGKIGVLVLIGL